MIIQLKPPSLKEIHNGKAIPESIQHVEDEGKNNYPQSFTDFLGFYLIIII